MQESTTKQQDYIEILRNDVGIDTIVKRNDFISLRVGRPIRFLDELTMSEASAIIVALKAKKEENQQRDKNPDWNQA